MHLKGMLTNITKGAQSITEYMQHAKSIADELAMLDTPENSEDLTVKILNGLGDEFKDISSVVRARDFAISFEELHEKLLNSEALLKQESIRIQQLPITANFATKLHQPNQNRNNSRNYAQHTARSGSTAAGQNFRTQTPQNSPNSAHGSGPRPYHGFCQLCSEQGHTAKRCTTFNISPAIAQPQSTQSRPQWQPRAHYAAPHSTTPE
ncbi:hypothetical protein LWI29_000031 [Acer saccharum]|uniref:Uncharacterized protein n=1 Tax=Acer saccharum TaxID=4024 RepID=A0AA39VMR4_ACESA|nr:hypothetical protein LWI29_000031 [Acer saccharum]